MAFDELLNKNLGIVTGHLSAALIRWRAAANAARSSTFTSDVLFENLRAQFVQNWDTWNALMAGWSTVPTVTIEFQANAAAPQDGSIIVKQRLTGMNFDKTPLDEFGGANIVPAGDYGVSITGIFDGELQVTIKKKPPTGEYRGMVCGSTPNVYVYQPIAWVVVKVV